VNLHRVQERSQIDHSDGYHDLRCMAAGSVSPCYETNMLFTSYIFCGDKLCARCESQHDASSHLLEIRRIVGRSGGVAEGNHPAEIRFCRNNDEWCEGHRWIMCSVWRNQRLGGSSARPCGKPPTMGKTEAGGVFQEFSTDKTKRLGPERARGRPRIDARRNRVRSHLPNQRRMDAQSLYEDFTVPAATWRNALRSVQLVCRPAEPETMRHQIAVLSLWPMC